MFEIAQERVRAVLAPRLSGGAVLAAMGDPVVVVGFDTALLWANRAAKDRFGWLVDDLAGQPLRPLVHVGTGASETSSLPSSAAGQSRRERTLP